VRVFKFFYETLRIAGVSGNFIGVFEGGYEQSEDLQVAPH